MIFTVIYSFHTVKLIHVGLLQVSMEQKKVNLIVKKNVNGRILLLKVEIDCDVYVLVNLCYDSNEPYQLSTLSELHNFLNSASNISYKKILRGDFNFFFDSITVADGGTPTLKTTVCKIYGNQRKP